MKKSVFLASIFFLVFSVCKVDAADITVFGPKEYLRTTMTPNIYGDDFSAMAGKATLVVRNGEEDGTNKISSAILQVNGNEILGPNDFYQGFYEKTIFLYLREENNLSVELRSNPGSYLVIEIKQEVHKIAYVSVAPGSFDIYTLVLDDNINVLSNTRITSSPPENRSPIWSRNGKKIAYRSGNHEIWTMDEDGSNKQKAVISSLFVFPEVWGIDPNYVYGDNHSGGDGEVAKFNIVSGTIEMLTNVPGYNTQSFDLNSKQTNIAYVRGVEGNGWSNQLYTADFVSNGSDFQNIMLLPAAIPAPHEPKYSPFGSRIMFLIMEPPYYTGIGIISTDNTGYWTPIPISSYGTVGSADWIDEYRIVYSYGPYSGGNLFVLDLRDNSTKQITFTMGDKYFVEVFKN